MRNRSIIAILVVFLTLVGLGFRSDRLHGHHLKLGPELYSGSGNVTWSSTASSDGVNTLTVVGFRKPGHTKDFIFCGDQADLFEDHGGLKYAVSFRWNPNRQCDQLTGVTREAGSGWDTVWFFPSQKEIEEGTIY